MEIGYRFAPERLTLEGCEEARVIQCTELYPEFAIGHNERVTRIGPVALQEEFLVAHFHRCRVSLFGSTNPLSFKAQ